RVTQQLPPLCTKIPPTFKTPTGAKRKHQICLAPPSLASVKCLGFVFAARAQTLEDPSHATVDMDNGRRPGPGGAGGACRSETRQPGRSEKATRGAAHGARRGGG